MYVTETHKRGSISGGVVSISTALPATLKMCQAFARRKTLTDPSVAVTIWNHDRNRFATYQDGKIIRKSKYRL